MKNQKIGRILSNTFLMLGYIWKYTPGLLVWTVVSAVLGGSVRVIDTVYIAKYVLDGIQKGQTFAAMIPFFVGVLCLNLVMIVVQCLYKGSYYPKQTQYLYGRMHEELFAKAKDMDLACYDNPKFYNDFVWAMSQADEKALQVLDNTRELLSLFTSAGGVIALLVSIDITGLCIAVFGIVISALFQKHINKITVEQSLEQKPIQRKRDYTSRIMYQPDYAKEIRLTPVKGILVDNFRTTNKKLIEVLRTYGKKIVLYDAAGFDLVYCVMLYGFYILYLLYRTLVLHAYTYGGFYAVFSGTYNFVEYWSGFAYQFLNIAKNSVYIEKFRTFMEYEPQIKEKPDALEVPQQREELRFEHVTFAYDEGKPVIKDLNLTIQPGEKIAVVGYNGAGKSTLVKLLLRLYDVKEGAVYLGGEDIRSYKLKEYRQSFGVVFQDYQLFAATVGENVMADVTGVQDEEAILRAIEKSGLKKKVEKLPYGTETMVSREFDKNGVALSGGEAQKLAIARMFPGHCNILVLDEPSSALDPVSEYEVMQSVLKESQDKTVIFISHRLSTTAIADRIVMLEDGRIIEQGSHAELMQADGKYAEMYRIQAEKYQL